MYLQIVFQHVEYFLSPRISWECLPGPLEDKLLGIRVLVVHNISPLKMLCGVTWHLTVTEEVSETCLKFCALVNKLLLNGCKNFLPTYHFSSCLRQNVPSAFSRGDLWWLVATGLDSAITQVQIQPCTYRILKCYGLNCVPQKDMLKSCTPRPRSVTFFGNRIFANIIKLGWGH